MIITETVAAAAVEPEKKKPCRRNLAIWRIGLLADSLNRPDKNVKTDNDDDDDDEDDNKTDKSSPAPQEEADTKATIGVSINELERLRYLGIAEAYANSNTAATANTANRDKWTAIERQRWKFKIIFFVVYTLLTVTSFALIYNLYNYCALILQIVNLSVTYMLLMLAL